MSGMPTHNQPDRFTHAMLVIVLFVLFGQTLLMIYRELRIQAAEAAIKEAVEEFGRQVDAAPDETDTAPSDQP